MTLEPLPDIQGKITLLYEGTEAARQNIEEQTDGPFEMTIALRTIDDRTADVETEVTLLQYAVRDLIQLNRDLLQQRDEALLDRDMSYIDGWEAAMASPQVWQWIIDSLQMQGQEEAATQVARVIHDFLNRYPKPDTREHPERGLSF